MVRGLLHLFLKYVVALASGLLVGVVLVTAYEFLTQVISQWDLPEGAQTMLGTPAEVAIWTAFFALIYGVIIELACTPVWFLVGRMRLHSYFSAGILGFGMTLGMALYVFRGGTFDAESFTTSLPYALSGALAGMACWWLSPARRAQ